MPSEPTTIQTRLDSVHRRIAQAERRWQREPGSVRLLAVSKTRPARDIEAAYRAGQRAFGESYLQEAVAKIEANAHSDCEWHFIGPIQKNKTRSIAAHFDWVHSIDRLAVARRLDEQRPAGAPALQVCVQVNISGEASKSGVEVAELAELAHAVQTLPNLRLRGLMAIPAPAVDFDHQREACAGLRRLYQSLRAEGLALDTLSMGMSDDLEAAIAEGATLVRIGTAIFGPRPPRPD